MTYMDPEFRTILDKNNVIVQPPWRSGRHRNRLYRQWPLCRDPARWPAGHRGPARQHHRLKHHKRRDGSSIPPLLTHDEFLSMKRRLVLAGVPVDVITAYDDYYPYFSPYLEKNGGTTRDIPPCPINDRDIPSVRIPPQRLRKAASIYQPGEPEYYVEYMELCPAVSSAITAFGRIVFHAVSFIWKDLAWLITAPSGTGKSTHYCLWKLLCPDAVQIINGDKPIVYMENDQVFVTSSPWTGKENMSQRLTAKLGGIIFLEQAKTNEIRRLTVHESAGKIFSQFLFDCNTEQEVKSACKIAENMLKSPVWLLKNRGDIQSAQLCRDTLAAALSDPAMNPAKK